MTPSTISVQLENEVRTIYSNRWGEPDLQYGILSDHYDSQELAEGLVNLGDISMLKNDIYSTRYYTRDCNADGCSYVSSKNLNEVKDKEQYHYFWDGGSWSVFDGEDEVTFDYKRITYIEVV